VTVGATARHAPRRETPLRYLRGVGPRKAEKLAAAGFETVGDLLFHLPTRYEDRRNLVSPVEVRSAGTWTVTGRLAEMRSIRTRRRGFVMIRGRLEGPGGSVALLWFNQPYLLQRFADGDEVLLHGAARELGGGLHELVNPSVERHEPGMGGTVTPIYASLAGIGPGVVRRLLGEALAALAEDPPPDPLPAAVLARYRFPGLAGALREIHRPAADADVEALDRRESPAHLRMVYQELLELQLELAELRRLEVRIEKGHRYRVDDSVRERARTMLPFALTAAQKRVVREIVEDLRAPHPMLRLLQGDVGSGKTIVAALALLIAAESGLQGAFMAPTELLAEQQHASLKRLLGERCRVELFTGSASDRDRVAALAAGEVAIAVGTHALIQGGIAFARLGLAVIDEQHRFGVEQRRLLLGKGDRPDLLVMTATPIPRTLALTAYGDLAISTLDELPPGRRPVATEVVPASRRREVYGRLAEELSTGARAYVVLPLIEESEELSAASLEELGDKVRRYLGRYPSAMLHGRLPAAEREALHRRFARGDLRLLISTTVIEVGIDVPEASWMVIESAERFGLAQLHQLRGRVGRGERASRCVAIHGSLTEAGKRRLEVFASTTDGFAIADADLAMRGPGDLLGTRQAGLPSLRFADLVTHRAWFERARSDAAEWIDRLDDPGFEELAGRVRRRGRDRYRLLAGA